MELKDFEQRFVEAFRVQIEDASSFTIGRNKSGEMMLKRDAPCAEFGYLAVLVPEPDMIVVGCAVAQSSLYAWHHEELSQDPRQAMIDEALTLIGNILSGRVTAKMVHHANGSPALCGFRSKDEAPLTVAGSSALLEKYFGGEGAVTEYAWHGLTKH